MKKILYITTLSRTINAFLVPHIESQLDRGNIVDCACFIDKDRELPLRLKDRNVNFFDVPFSRNPLDFNNLKAFKELIKIQNENNYDIVHVHTPIAAIYGRLLKVKFPNLKTVYTAHGFHFYKGAPKINWIIYYTIERFMARYTDVILTMNEEDYLNSKKFKIKNTYKINGVGLDLNHYNALDIDRSKIRHELGLKDDDFVVIMIAEFNKNKNHKQMIDAVEILKKRNIEIRVLCLDDGVLFDEISEYINSKGLNENVKLLGFRKNVNEIICASDVGILMSYREGLPRNIMEIMACKKPVIGTNIRGIKDLIIDGYNGFLVNIGDAESTADRIEDLLSDRELLGKMSESAYGYIQDYAIENIVNYLEGIY